MSKWKLQLCCQFVYFVNVCIEKRLILTKAFRPQRVRNYWFYMNNVLPERYLQIDKLISLRFTTISVLWSFSLHQCLYIWIVKKFSNNIVVSNIIKRFVIMLIELKKLKSINICIAKKKKKGIHGKNKSKVLYQTQSNVSNKNMLC